MKTKAGLRRKIDKTTALAAEKAWVDRKEEESEVGEQRWSKRLTRDTHSVPTSGAPSHSSWTGM